MKSLILYLKCHKWRGHLLPVLPASSPQILPKNRLQEVEEAWPRGIKKHHSSLENTRYWAKLKNLSSNTILLSTNLCQLIHTNNSITAQTLAPFRPRPGNQHETLALLNPPHRTDAHTGGKDLSHVKQKKSCFKKVTGTVELCTSQEGKRTKIRKGRWGS